MGRPPPETSDIPSYMLSKHSNIRDRYGIPVVYDVERVNFRKHSEEEKREALRWNQVHKPLHSVTADVRGLQRRIDFSQNWLLPHLNPARHLSIHQSTDLTIDSSHDTLVKDEIAALEKKKVHLVVRWKETLVAVGILLRHALIDIPDIFPRNYDPDQSPWTLIRSWNDDSHTEYDDALGFRCSNWNECKPAASFSELEGHDILTTQGLRDHCEMTRRPSCWISLCDDASWTLKHVKGARHVAIVSVPKLNRLNILWQRSDILLEQAGGKAYNRTHKDGVCFAWRKHYLVYGWIPVQCVIRKYTVEDFQRLCKERSITTGDMSVQPPHKLLGPSGSPDSSEQSLTDRLGGLQLTADGTTEKDE